MYDIIIVGGGPAGMTAAIYGASARKKVLILEKDSMGGQILKTNKIKNYPGFEEISGFDYSNNLFNQVKKLDVEVKFEEVLKINKDKSIITNKNKYNAGAIIIATGSKNKTLNILNEDKFLGKGISYCATCDGMFFKGKNVAIVGGGNSSISEALYLSNIVKNLYVIYRQKEFKFDSIDLETLKKKDNVTFIFNSTVSKLNGNEFIESITVKNNEDNNELEISVDGLFISIGFTPLSSLCEEILELSDNGYILSNEECTTNIDGVFVAGDVRKKSVRQLTTACSDGTIAAIKAFNYLNRKK